MFEELHGAKTVGAGQSGSPLAGSTHPEVGMGRVLSVRGNRQGVERKWGAWSEATVLGEG